MAPKPNLKINVSDTAPAETNPEHDKLLEVLKFTPRTYKLRVYGYGGEYVMGKVDRKIFDYFKSRRLSFEEFCYDDSYAEENNIPEEMWPFTPGQWYDCDDLVHVNGADMDAGTLEIEDEQNEIIYSKDLNEITDDGIELMGGDEAYIHLGVDDKTAIFFGISSEKGMFFETQIELTAPFDKEKLTIVYDDVDGAEIMCGAKYDDEDLDCYDMSTNGKGYDMYLYAKKDDGIEHYKNIDSIDWPMTEWYPKKVKPTRPGLYEVEETGKNAWKRHAEWDGENWINQWDNTIMKIKQWRGITIDPDSIVVPEVEVAEKETTDSEETKRVAWSVKPTYKKSILERNFLYKDGETFIVETGWRWGEFIVFTEDDDPPNLEEGVDIYDCGYESELVETSDGCWEDHDMDGCKEETKIWLEEFLEDNSWLDLEEHGWTQGDCEMIINSELEIERAD
jgi:hypothetical protein